MYNQNSDLMKQEKFMLPTMIEGPALKILGSASGEDSKKIICAGHLLSSVSTFSKNSKNASSVKSGTGNQCSLLHPVLNTEIWQYSG